MTLNEYIEYRILYLTTAEIIVVGFLTIGLLTLFIGKIAKFSTERQKINPLYTQLGASRIKGSLTKIERIVLIVILSTFCIAQIEILRIRNPQLTEVSRTEINVNDTDVYEITYYDKSLDVNIVSYKLKEKNEE